MKAFVSVAGDRSVGIDDTDFDLDFPGIDDLGDAREQIRADLKKVISSIYDENRIQVLFEDETGEDDSPPDEEETEFPEDAGLGYGQACQRADEDAAEDDAAVDAFLAQAERDRDEAFEQSLRGLPMDVQVDRMAEYERLRDAERREPKPTSPPTDVFDDDIPF
jgi:hypothetical protein